MAGAANWWDTDAHAPSITGVIPAAKPKPSEILRDKRTTQEIENNPLDVEVKRQSLKKSRTDQALSMAQDYNSNPDVKAYNSILPTYAAALQSPETPAGDQGLVYAMAKVMQADGSAVRSEEVQNTESLQPYIDQIKAQYGKQMNGDGTFLPTARKQIREAMAQKMAFLNRAYINQRVRYKEQADRAGLDPRDVVGDHTGIGFQETEAKFLGHPVSQADYRGNVIPNGPQTPPNSPAGGPPDETGKYAGADIRMHMDSPENAQGYRFTPTQETALHEYLTGGNATPEGYGRMMTAFAAAQGVNVDDAYTQSATAQGQKLIEAAKAGKLGDGMSYNQSDKDYRDSLLKEANAGQARETGELLASGTLAGGLDEARGIVGGASSLLKGDGFEKGYVHDRDLTRAVRDNAYEKRPIISGATEMLGALATPGGVSNEAVRGGSLAERMVAMGKAGRNQGIAAGYGYGEGTGGSLKGAVVGGATGMLIGGALPLASKPISAAYNFVTKPNVAAERAGIREAANRQGVNIFPPDLGGPSMKRAAAGLEQSFFGVDRIRRSAKDSVDSFAARARTVAGEPARPVDVGNSMSETASRVATRHADRARATTAAVVNATGVPTDITTAGQILQRGANQFLPDTADRATQLYNRVQIAPNAETSVEAVRGALREMTGGMQSNPAMRQLFESPRLRNYLEALTPQIDQETGQVIRPGSLSWQDLGEFRTRIGDMLDDPRLSEKIAPRQLRALYAAITTDMETTARRAGPEVYRNWRRANDFYDGRQKRLNDTLSLVLGQRRDATPNEAFARLEQMMSDGPSGHPAAFRRILRTLAPADAATIRATLTSRAAGGPNFDAAELAKRWPAISERAKSALLPNPGMRNLMDDAAEQAATAATNPLAGKSGEQIFNAFEAMASSRGDSARFRSTLANMSPEEAAQARATLISRMGETAPGAQNADGNAFSPSRWLTRWQTFTPEAKMALVGNGKMRADMDDLAMLADRMKDSAKFAGHSNTGAINNFNATTGGLGAAVFALLSGHPVIAASLAGPAAYQTIGAKLLTSQRMLNWMTRAPKMLSAESQAAHIARLSTIAAREPAISGDVISLQNYLAAKFSETPLASAAAPGQGRNDRRPPPENNGQ